MWTGEPQPYNFDMYSTEKVKTATHDRVGGQKHSQCRLELPALGILYTLRREGEPALPRPQLRSLTLALSTATANGLGGVRSGNETVPQRTGYPKVFLEVFHGLLWVLDP